MVYIFSTEGGCAPFLRQNIAAFRETANSQVDLNTDEAIRAYFKEVLYLRDGGTSSNDALDRQCIFVTALV